MLNFRKETEYAMQFLQFLSECSKENCCKSLQEFAKSSDISFYFMQKIARKLSRNGIITATQGVNGGYVLTMVGKKMSLFDLIEIMEDGVALLPCVSDVKKCNKDAKCCKVRVIMCKLNKEIIKILGKIKVV